MLQLIAHRNVHFGRNSTTSFFKEILICKWEIIQGNCCCIFTSLGMRAGVNSKCGGLHETRKHNFAEKRLYIFFYGNGSCCYTRPTLHGRSTLAKLWNELILLVFDTILSVSQNSQLYSVWQYWPGMQCEMQILKTERGGGISWGTSLDFL